MIAACWNTIGVRGDRTCEQLTTHVHCRNCPVYSSVARELLDRTHASDDTTDSTRHFAAALQSEPEASRSLMIFRIEQEWLAVSADIVVEVAELRAIHPLPHRRGGVVLGVANIRGELMTCVSLVALLQSAPSGAATSARPRRLLVIRFGALRVACPADDVHGLEQVGAKQLTSAPATVTNAAAHHTTSVLPWRGHSVGVLDEVLLASALRRSLS
jgi:chemotaxis-related protein WspD